MNLPLAVTDTEKYEMHCQKRYLECKENENFRAFRQKENPTCWSFNYAVLKNMLQLAETFVRVQEFFKENGATAKFRSAPDSVPLTQARAAFLRYGYAVQEFEETRMTLQAPPVRNLRILPLVTKLHTMLERPQERALVHLAAGAQAYGVPMVKTQLQGGAKAFFAYNKAGVPVSYCLGEGYGSVFYLSDLFTPVPCRGQGCATAVLAAAVAYAKEAGYVTVFLDVTDPKAQVIYERFGFRGVAQKGYWAFCGALPKELA